MKKLALLGTLAMVACSGALLAHVHASSPKEATLAAPPRELDDTFACSNATLTGTYGLSINGTRPVPPSLNFPPGTIEQLIGVETETFDGNGNFTQIDNVKGSLSGILVPNHAVSGSYTVNADCTGKVNLTTGVPFPIVVDIVIVNHGQEFRGIVASPQLVMVSSNGRRVN